MDKNTVVYIAIGAGVILVGAGLYLYFRKPTSTEKIDLPAGVVAAQATAKQKAGTSGVSASQYPSTGFSQADGDAFRQWVNTNYPAYAKSISLDKSGAPDNSYIRKAYQQYGSQYNSDSTQTVDSTIPTTYDQAQAVLLDPNASNAAQAAAQQIVNQYAAQTGYGNS